MICPKVIIYFLCTCILYVWAGDGKGETERAGGFGRRIGDR